MLTIVEGREKRPAKLIEGAQQIADSIIRHPALFAVLVEVFAQCRTGLREIDDVLDGVMQVDECALQLFRTQLLSYFQYPHSSWGYGNRRGLLLEELISLLEIQRLNVIDGPVKRKVRDADFYDAQMRRVSELEKNLDIAFEGEAVAAAIECKLRLKNWLLQDGSFTTRGSEKLRYIHDIYSYCCRCEYKISMCFCCLDDHRDLVQAREAIKGRYSYITIIDKEKIIRALK